MAERVHSLPQFLQWLKLRSAKSKNSHNRETTELCMSKTTGDHNRERSPAVRKQRSDQAVVSTGVRDSCRGCARLPQLPREQQRQQRLLALKSARSPEHVYEEIPPDMVADQSDQQHHHYHHQLHSCMVSQSCLPTSSCATRGNHTQNLSNTTVNCAQYCRTSGVESTIAGSQQYSCDTMKFGHNRCDKSVIVHAAAHVPTSNTACANGVPHSASYTSCVHPTTSTIPPSTSTLNSIAVTGAPTCSANSVGQTNCVDMHHSLRVSSADYPRGNQASYVDRNSNYTVESTNEPVSQWSNDTHSSSEPINDRQVTVTPQRKVTFSSSNMRYPIDHGASVDDVNVNIEMRNADDNADTAFKEHDVDDMLFGGGMMWNTHQGSYIISTAGMPIKKHETQSASELRKVHMPHVRGMDESQAIEYDIGKAPNLIMRPSQSRVSDNPLVLSSDSHHKTAHYTDDLPTHKDINSNDTDACATRTPQPTRLREIKQRRAARLLAKNRQSAPELQSSSEDDYGFSRRPKSKSHDQKLSNKVQDNTADPENSSVNLGNLDFAKAKEFGGFLVVPMRGRSKRDTSEQQSPKEGSNDRSPNGPKPKQHSVSPPQLYYASHDIEHIRQSFHEQLQIQYERESPCLSPDRKSAFTKYIPVAEAKRQMLTEGMKHGLSSPAIPKRRNSFSTDSSGDSGGYHDLTMTTSSHQSSSADSSPAASASDQSNDTYSEYDVHGGGVEPEYDVCLQKVQQVRSLSANVQEILKSESESDDMISPHPQLSGPISNGRLAKGQPANGQHLAGQSAKKTKVPTAKIDIAAILDIVSSGDNNALINEFIRENNPHYCNSAIFPHPRQQKQSVKCNKPNNTELSTPHTDSNQASSANVNQTWNTGNNTQCRSGQIKQPWLPEDSQSGSCIMNQSQASNMNQSQVNNNIVARNASQDNKYISRNAENPDRLSCRVTNFVLPTKPIHRSVDQDEVPVKRPLAAESQNRLLNDLMRHNHDRQLFL